VVKKVDPKKYAQRFTSISLCLSKGLGAPIGSVLIGDADFIKKARRVRKVLGGGMRQAGIIAAGGLYAFKNNVARLAQDHFHATLLGESFKLLPWVESVYPIHTNIVVVCLKKPNQKEKIIQLLKENGIVVSSFGEGMIRLVTHLDISKEEIDTAISIINKLEVID